MIMKTIFVIAAVSDNEPKLPTGRVGVKDKTNDEIEYKSDIQNNKKWEYYSLNDEENDTSL